MRAISFIIVLAIASVCKAATPQLSFAWKEVDYVWNTPADRENAINEGRYIPENNFVLGVARWKNKLFVTLPKWKRGVVSSLNYVDIDGPQDQPLKPYPSFEDNYVPDTAKALPTNSSIISVFRVFVDACDRLWVMDTGIADRRGFKNQIDEPSIVIFDLNTDQLLHRHYFKAEVKNEKSFFGNIVVEVEKDKCDNAFAYVPDLFGYSLVVYSLKQDDSWLIKHDYFNHDPLAASYDLSGIQFEWTDGVFGLALSGPREDGYLTMYFHPLSSTKEFSVSTEILRNYPHISKEEASKGFKLLGDRGERGQSAASYYDQNTSVLFYTQISRHGVGCWNSNKPYTSENNPLIIQDPVQIAFPIDLKVDNEGIVWLMSDELPRFFYQTLDPTAINYRIFSIKASEAIAGTSCE